VVGIGTPPEDDGDDRPLLVPLVARGEVVGRATLEEARTRHRTSVAELPRAVTMMSAGEAVIPTMHLGG
jgi:nicotinate phosphoribosyltransferase